MYVIKRVPRIKQTGKKMSYKQRLQIQRLQKTVTNNERLQTTVSKQPLQRLKKQLEINKTTKKHFQVMVTDYMFKKKNLKQGCYLPIYSTNKINNDP